MGISFPPDDDPAPAPEIEALKREIERLRALDGPDRRMLEAILEESPHGFIVCDSNGRLVLQNRASEKIWAGSASASSVAEWDRYRGFHPDGRPYAPEDWPMARCLATGAATEPEEIRFQRFDGTFGVLLASGAPITGEDGRCEGAIAVFADVTRFKKGAERTEQLLAISEALSRATTADDVVRAVVAPLAQAVGAVAGALRLLPEGTPAPPL